MAQELLRMLDLSVGVCNPHKLQALAALRKGYIEHANTFAKTIFSREPLKDKPTKKQSTKILLSLQKKSTGLNKSYVEKARRKATDVVHESHDRYIKQLIGRLAHCSERILNPQDSRLFYYVPETLQQTIQPSELQELEKIVKKGSSQKAIALFRAVLFGEQEHFLSQAQVAVICEIHRQVQAKHRCPVFGKDKQMVVQIHLDYRQVAEQKKLLEKLNAEATLLFDEGNKKYQTFLSLANPTPREEKIRLPLCLRAKTLRRLDKQGRLNSFVLELCEKNVKLKAVVSKAKPDCKSFEKLKYVIGRDFGYNNTCTWSVAQIDGTLEEKEVQRRSRFKKKEAKAFLESHKQQRENIVERRRFEGRRFLALMAEHSTGIEKLSSELDRIYNKIGRLKRQLQGALGLLEDEQVPESLGEVDALVQRVHRKFFCLLEEVRGLKGKRRGLYEKMRAVRKNWFGYLSNQEVQLALKYEALVVREDLDLRAERKESPKYKGKAFNKMMSWGARGCTRRWQAKSSSIGASKR